MNRKISVFCGSLPLRAGEILAETPHNGTLVKVLPLQVSCVAGDRSTADGFVAWASRTSDPDRVRVEAPR